MSGSEKRKPLPRFETDEDAARFVEEADLTDYDLSGFAPSQFEFEKNAARVTMRLPSPLLDAVNAAAQARGIPYQRFIREAIEAALSDRRHHD